MAGVQAFIVPFFQLVCRLGKLHSKKLKKLYLYAALTYYMKVSIIFSFHFSVEYVIGYICILYNCSF